MIPYGKQDLNQEDINEVINVLKSDFITQGPKVPLFEQKISDYCNVKYSVAVNSATSALHVACMALDLNKGDWLWTSPNSFVASANCGIYCGANIDFVDIDPNTYNLSIELLEKKLIQAKKNNKLPKILVTVHFAGQSCEMEKIHNLSKKFGFLIIEDASHAIGGKYKNHKIGSCKYSDITVFSFHPVKIITTAEGGIATTNSTELYEKMKFHRTHGITRDKKYMSNKDEGGWYYEQVDLGHNYRMTEIQAALGISQLKRLDNFVLKRHVIKNKYDKDLKDLPIIKPYQIDDSYSALHLYPIQIILDKVKKSRKEIFNELRVRGIGVNVHYIPIHYQPFYQKLGFNTGDFPNSENYYKSALSIPMYSSLTKVQQNEVVEQLKFILI